MRWKVWTVVGVALLAGCSSSDDELEPLATTDPKCNIGAPTDGTVVNFSSGSDWAGDLSEMHVLGDGTVKVRRTVKSGEPDEEKTVTIGAGAVTALLADLKATGLSTAQSGCYYPKETAYDVGGYSFDFTVDGVAHVVSVSSAAKTPAAVDRAYDRIGQAFADAEKR